jgi:hypothetical protein
MGGVVHRGWGAWGPEGVGWGGLEVLEGLAWEDTGGEERQVWEGWGPGGALVGTMTTMTMVVPDGRPLAGWTRLAWESLVTRADAGRGAASSPSCRASRSHRRAGAAARRGAPPSGTGGSGSLLVRRTSLPSLGKVREWEECGFGCTGHGGTNSSGSFFDSTPCRGAAAGLTSRRDEILTKRKENIN